MDAALVEETFRVTLTLRARPEELSCPLFDQVRNAGDWLQESWWGGAEPAEVVRWQVERASAPAPAPAPAPGAALVGEGAVVHVHVAAEDAAPMRLLLAQAGRAVWNAPRPLDGLVRWTGPFRQGLFYAAGPATRLAARNAELGARVELLGYVRLVHEDPGTYAPLGDLHHALGEVARRLEILAITEV